MRTFKKDDFPVLDVPITDITMFLPLLLEVYYKNKSNCS